MNDTAKHVGKMNTLDNSRRTPTGRRTKPTRMVHVAGCSCGWVGAEHKWFIDAKAEHQAHASLEQGDKDA